MQCAVAEVPLDYSRPTRHTIRLALMRRPAAAVGTAQAGKPSRRLGTLFFNPGGPGVSGIHFLPLAAAALSPEVVEVRG